MQDGQNQPQVTPEQPQTNWQYQAPEQAPSAGSVQLPAPPQAQPPAQVEWTASEFVAHHKNFSWYLAVLGVFALFAGVVYLFTRDLISTVVILIVGISFMFFAARKPRELHYVLADNGIYMGEKFYPYSQFKSFALIEEDAALAVWLMPLKRFMPIMSMYFDPQDEDKITNALTSFLPLESHEPDVVDKLLHRIRF